MSREKFMDYALESKELEELKKAHGEFDKTLYGKRINLFIRLMGIKCVLYIILGFLCIVLNLMGDENFDIYAILCFVLFGINSSLILVIQTIYENMVMNYLNRKK